MTTTLNDLRKEYPSASWEAEQDAEIKAELEAEIEASRRAIEMLDKSWFRPEWKGIKREAMRRHYERKLANAEEFYNEAVENGWLDGEADSGYTCGGTGKPCMRRQRTDGSFPCDECAVGIEFCKAWEGQPVLMDD